MVVVDNLYNSSEKAIERVEEISGKKVTFYKEDLLNKEGLNRIFDQEKVDAVIHFAGLKAVGESVQKPLEYYHNNMTGTFYLCDVMRNHGGQEYYLQFLRNGLRRSGVRSHHRGMPQGKDHESLWADQGDAGAGADRSAYRGS